jgi:hypothetical protein
MFRNWRLNISSTLRNHAYRIGGMKAKRTIPSNYSSTKSGVVSSVFVFSILCSFSCAPLNLNNPSDGASRDFLLTAFLRSYRSVSTFNYSPNKLTSETGITSTQFSGVDRGDLRDCRAETALPSNWSLSGNGTYEQWNANRHAAYYKL